jgi:cell wall-associated NlpC family hydrolase
MKYNYAIAQEAPNWEGTPFHWQASVKGEGVDCKGLVVGILHAAGVPCAKALDVNFKGYAEHKKVNSVLLRKTLKKHCSKVDMKDAVAGDILLIRIEKVSQHLGILLDGKEFMHATPARGACRAKIGSMTEVDSVWRVSA